MHTDPKRDAQKAEDSGLAAEPEEKPRVAESHEPGEEGVETARERDRTEAPVRPRQDSLDRERAAGEGMTAPPSNP